MKLDAIKGVLAINLTKKPGYYDSLTIDRVSNVVARNNHGIIEYDVQTYCPMGDEIQKQRAFIQGYKKLNKERVM